MPHHFERLFRNKHIGWPCWLGVLALWAAFSPAVARGQVSNRTMRSVFDKMVVQQQRFDAKVLHNMGLPGLCAVLDFLLPDTAEEETVDVPSDKVARLVEQLGDENYQTRQTAHETLLDMGPSIRTALWPALENEDAEIRWRVTRILRRWSGASDEDKKRYAAAFSAYVNGISDDERLKELARRTQLALQAGMPKSGRYSILSYSIRAIARSRKDQYINQLKPLLQHDDVEVASLVVKTVGSGCGSTFLPELLLDGLKSDRDKVVESAILYTVNYSNTKHKEEIKRCLIKVFEGDNSSLKLSASYPLMRSYRYEPAIDYLLEQAVGKDPSRANRALSWLADSRNLGQPISKKMLDTFDVLLKSEDWTRRRLACRALGMHSGEEVVERLIPLLNDKHASVSGEASGRLLYQRDKKMLGRLLSKAAKEHPDEKVREKAAVVLKKVRVRGSPRGADDPFR